jgi:hypothetical protein
MTLACGSNKLTINVIFNRVQMHGLFLTEYFGGAVLAWSAVLIKKSYWVELAIDFDVNGPKCREKIFRRALTCCFPRSFRPRTPSLRAPADCHGIGGFAQDALCALSRQMDLRGLVVCDADEHEVLEPFDLAIDVFRCGVPGLERGF